ncbi:hypothetical protein [Okeania sp. SIO2B9]|uniref:hypothetical protein n=1 Tax=Okeania sp. SIO2B9 TaxID=2607782 RepID=UPI001428E740|nr:hypothetical protein [Okeania sp. SIO2B9]NES87806.1 hypothetical protein [Okeania sp. SIO2B9]
MHAPLDEDDEIFTGTSTITEGLDAPREFAVRQISFDDPQTADDPVPMPPAA